MSTTFKRFEETSVLAGANASYVEDLYEQYLIDSNAVSPTWRKYFDGIKGDSNNECSRSAIEDKFAILAQMPTLATTANSCDIEKQIGVLNLIRGYRYRAHFSADLDPVHIRDRKVVLECQLKENSLSEADLDSVFAVDGIFGQKEMKLRDLVAKLEKTYNAHIGMEHSHIWETQERDWLLQQMENMCGEYNFSNDEKIKFLKDLIAADGLEKYLHKRYVGQKRFSLEGGDALIPLTQSLIHYLSEKETKEIGVAMAHRGRLNMLINVFGKVPQVLFDEFDGKFEAAKNRSGDVKYHMGFASRLQTDAGAVDLTLAYNPSHLEFVNAVQLGATRAGLERERVARGKNVEMIDVVNLAVPIMIHGDAALAGQGINQEALQLSQLRGYHVGGSIHVVVNNQIGFTTSNLEDARSSMYCTDIAKSIQVPIFHVNGDDPEAVVAAGMLAAQYLLKFKKDVFIDIVCYRRLGHNEADEPSATQPMMYQKIRNHPVPSRVYADKLIAAGIVDEQKYAQMIADYASKLDSGERVAAAKEMHVNDSELGKEWKKMCHQDWKKAVKTSFDKARLQELGAKIFTPPSGFATHKIVERILKTRREMVAGELELDWGTAENLAYATILDQGYQVRVSGEDCGRGTFSHRHSVLHDQQTGESYLPLSHIKEDQPSVRIIDSLLSEVGVLGFEYGYATTEPKALVIWEAQFGDFANGGQVIIDQFIASGETKWGRYCGLVMLLPHGYEGQGPEHSSARLERYLQLCACQNMSVCVPTTPAQIFHLLRLQVLREFRKPMIIMSPKSLLRHKLATNTIDEIANGSFQQIIDEIDDIKKKKVKRVILCSGKVYYDLLQKRRDEKIQDVAIIRVEQLYPSPMRALAKVFSSYPVEAEYIWCQEEPRNQGAWHRVLEFSMEVMPKGKRLRYVGRNESASTAAGYAKVHSAEQAELVARALNLPI